MPEALINKRAVERVLGKTRLARLLRAGWISPVAQPEGESRRRQPVLFSPRDLHAALRRVEQSVVPPDKIEVARVRASEARHGRSYVRKTVDPTRPLEEILSSLDFSAYM
jgi:hypothetical protein